MRVFDLPPTAFALRGPPSPQAGFTAAAGHGYSGAFVAIARFPVVIPVVVISLRRSMDRREAMSAHLGALGIPFSYFDGIDGSQMTQAEIAALRPPQSLGRYHFRMTPGEI